MVENSVLELSIALSDNARTRPVLDGHFQPEGIRLLPTKVHPSEMFWRQLKYADFDISEMSLSSLFIAVSKGATDWVALPIFTMRRFFHTRIQVRADVGIDSPADLRGKRVGVPEYQQTSVIWSRGILQHEFNVQASEIDWFMERGADISHGTATGFTPPDGVSLSTIPPETNIGEMLIAGELDATMHYLTDPNLVDRSRIDIASAAGIKPLFADPGAEAQRYYAKTGIFPINHGMVVRRSLFENHPWIALNVYSAFLKAKQAIALQAAETLEPFFDTGIIDADTEKSVRTADPLGYGIKKARRELETISQYINEQGLTDHRVAIEDVFAPNTLDL